jgi:hypothetical protein
MLFLLGGRLREVHFQNPKITDELWSEITKVSGLPQEARAEVQDCIGLYRQLRRDAERENRGLWKKLAATRDNEKKTLKSLTALVADPNFLPALSMGLDGQDEIPKKELESIRQWLGQKCDEKQKLVDWYERSIDRLHHRQRGPKKGRDSLFSLVYLLNSILDTYTGVKLSRSKAKNGGRNSFDYALKVCQIAEPNLAHRTDRGLPQVEEVAKQVIKEYRSHEDSFEISSWEELMPKWRPATNLVLESQKFGIRIEFRKKEKSSHWSFITFGQKQQRKPVRIIFPSVQPFVPEESVK